MGLLLPPSLPDEQRTMARVAAALPFVLAAFAWCITGTLVVTHELRGVPTGMAAGVLALVSAGALRAVRSLRIAVHVQLLVAQVVICVLSVAAPGVMLPAMALILPTIAGMLLGRRAAVVWGAIASAWLVVRLGPAAPWLDRWPLAPPAHARVNVVSMLLTMGVFVLLAVVHETVRRASTAELREARKRSQAASRAKTAFLANMSHEIRTPLHGLVGTLQLLRGTSLNRSQTSYVETMKLASESLLGVVNDVLDFSKVEAGQLEVEARELALAAAIEGVVVSFAPTALANGLDLRVEVSPDLPELVLGDGQRLSQVVSNLVSNAIKFTAVGEVVARVEVVERGDSEVLVEFAVVDTGIGIDTAMSTRLFRPFEQADPSTSRRYGGTGLGLSISARLVGLMGGELELESELGQGTTFRFSLRFAIVSARRIVDMKPSLDGMNVVLVDCGYDSRELCRRYLAASRVMVGTTSLDHLRAEPTADPERVAVLEVLRSTDEAEIKEAILVCAPMPVVVIGAPGPPPEWAEDCDAVLVQKPIRLQALREAVALAMEQTVSADLRRPAPDRGAARRLAAPILVAEDNRVNQIVVCRHLELAGYRSQVVPDGEAAVEAATGDDVFAAILMDCHMPTLDGYEATRKIRRFEKASGRSALPIIALTADAMPGTHERVLEAGMDAHVLKPFRGEELIALLDRHCIEKSSRSDDTHAA